MPLKSQRTYINGILNNCINIKDNIKEIPFNIYVYQLPDIIVKSNTTMEEYYIRQQLRGVMKPFNAHYYIGKRTIWSVVPAAHQILTVAICGTHQKTYSNTIKVLIYLLKKYKISLNQIFFNFQNDSFLEELKLEARKNDIEKHQAILEEQKIEVLPQIYYKVLIHNNWQIPDDQHYIKGIQIKSNIGVLNYRIHYYNREWSKWANNDEQIFSNDSYVDGFQLEFTDDEYKIEFMVLLEGRGRLPWKDKTQFSPYGKLIKSIDFRLIKKEGD